MALSIAVDAMGGDHAPEAVVDGALAALEASGEDLEIAMFGPTDRVQPLLDAAGVSDSSPLSLVHAPDVIEMTDAPAVAVKKKRQSSIHLGLGAHKDGQVDAFVSAGNTGAVMAASMFTLGRIAGVERPSIVGYFPTLRGSSIVVDIGTNVDCRPEHLLQFARMATVYTRHMLGIDEPSVGLLNIGEEPGKGNDQVKAAYEILGSAEGINFKGNVEGGDLLDYAADIIVCDGFVGNILLKFGESMTKVLKKMTKQEMERQDLSPSDQQTVAGVLGAVSKGFDPDARGGAPLLGVNGNVMIGHGGSGADAIKQMILTTTEVVNANVVDALKRTFQ
jgi:glycerol-3-phosphate acyltransferase PlsX